MQIVRWIELTTAKQVDEGCDASKGRLGHSKVGITLDLYSHVIPGMQQNAADMVDAAFKAAAEKRETNGSNPVAGRIGGTERE
jgi:hypothetical protein